MEESVLLFWDKLKDILLIDKVIARLMHYLGLIPDSVKDFARELYRDHRLACLIVAICGLALIAFEGYKLFKMALYAGGAAAFAIGGYYFIAPAVAKYAGSALPEWLDVKAAVAIVCALLAVFLTRCAYNMMIMTLGGIFGWLLGYSYVWRIIRDYFNTLQFLRQPTARYIIAGICASIFVLLFLLFFKHVFIIGSSFGCLGFAGWLLQKALVPHAEQQLQFCFILVGVAVGVFAVVRQYKEEEKAMEIVF